MKHFILITFLSFIGLQAAHAQSVNPHAPKLADVVAIYFQDDQEFSPYFFHHVRYADVLLNMKMDPTCPKIEVSRDRRVICVSPFRKVQVGLLTDSRPAGDFRLAFSISWFNNVQMIERKGPRGFEYSVQVIR